ncbi:MAG: hypothetical protein HYX52_06120 [Chloroflexi bacterium]|nr:hypothetical protein [Chloroflexota bacterium]
MTERAFSVTIDGETQVVHIRREGEEHLVRIGDSQERRARLDQVRGPLYALRLGERTIEVMLRRTGEETQMVVGGAACDAVVVDEARARLAKLAGASSVGTAKRELKAPMPGLVVKVLVQPGEATHKAQPLIVLQAMKMENELSLPHDGVVQHVGVEPGQTVEQGQVLVVLE